MSQAEFTQGQILEQLDACASDFTFPMLDNGYVYFIEARLSVYRTERYWAIVIEVLGSNFRASGVYNGIHRFGNCFPEAPGFSNAGILPLLNDLFNNALLDEDDRWDVVQETGFLRIRDQIIPYDVTPKALLQHGIGKEEMDTQNVTVTELMRTLVPEYRDLFFATEEELRQQIQANVPLILRLDRWNHPDLVEDELPSANETFQMIANVLVSGDPALYVPALPPNTHWKNWLESGTL